MRWSGPRIPSARRTQATRHCSRCARRSTASWRSARQPLYESIALLRRAGSFLPYDHIVAFADRQGWAVNPDATQRVLDVADGEDAFRGRASRLCATRVAPRRKSVAPGSQKRRYPDRRARPHSTSDSCCRSVGRSKQPRRPALGQTGWAMQRPRSIWECSGSSERTMSRQRPRLAARPSARAQQRVPSGAEPASRFGTVQGDIDGAHETLITYGTVNRRLLASRGELKRASRRPLISTSQKSPARSAQPPPTT